ncbi:MAG: hypothetical protein CMO80_20445 [Verrucomicrobiales bacterium]|nr:hypothetical protein [Verrucomicrobiales bacterium]|tara:strand:+ start:1625 stop:2686 length:1062 start_codon:yes stop_codon:yes gene_type:complete
MLPDPLTRSSATTVKWKGREWLYFGGCDYLGMSWNKRVRSTLIRGLNAGGASASASRTTTGNNPAYPRLEEKLADFFQVQSATLVPTGYLTNLAAMQALDVPRVALDERAHPSLVDATRVLGVPTVRFKSADVTGLERKLRGRPALVATDGVFAPDGAISPIAKYLQVMPGGSWLLVDDAHGAGVLGANGRGTVEYAGAKMNRVIQTITFSKAFGVAGGAVLAARKVRKNMMERTGVVIASTPIAPYQAKAIEVSVDLIRRGACRRKLKRNCEFLGSLIGEELPFPIINRSFESLHEVNRLKESLQKNGIHPPFINYPGGARGGFFRFAISAEHTRVDLKALANSLNCSAPEE